MAHWIVYQLRRVLIGILDFYTMKVSKLLFKLYKCNKRLWKNISIIYNFIYIIHPANF